MSTASDALVLTHIPFLRNTATTQEIVTTINALIRHVTASNALQADADAPQASFAPPRRCQPNRVRHLSRPLRTSNHSVDSLSCSDTVQDPPPGKKAPFDSDDESDSSSDGDAPSRMPVCASSVRPKHRQALVSSGSESPASVPPSQQLSQSQFKQQVNILIHENSRKNMTEYVQMHSELVGLVNVMYEEIIHVWCRGTLTTSALDKSRRSLTRALQRSIGASPDGLSTCLRRSRT